MPDANDHVAKGDTLLAKPITKMITQFLERRLDVLSSAVRLDDLLDAHRHVAAGEVLVAMSEVLVAMSTVEICNIDPTDHLQPLATLEPPAITAEQLDIAIVTAVPTNLQPMLFLL